MNKVTMRVDVSPNIVRSVLSLKNVTVFSLSGTEKSTFTVRKDEEKIVLSVWQEKGKCVEILKDTSLSGLWKLTGARSGIIVGVILVFCSFFIYSSFITKISIKGNKNINSETLTQIIEENIDLPSMRKSIDLSLIKKQICRQDGVSDANVYFEGNTLCLEIMETLPSIPNKEEKDIVSNYDGVITKISVFAGKQVKAVGDTVRKGEVLISKDEQGCDGEIFGRVWVSSHSVFTSTRIVSERTGQKKVFYGNVKNFNSYSLFEKTEEKIFFPFFTKKTTYYELSEKEILTDFEKNKEEIIASETKKLEGSLPPACEKIKSWYFVKTVDKMTILDIYYEIIIELSS